MSGTALLVVIIGATIVLVAAVGGQPPTFYISTQPSYQIGHVGYLVVNAHNQWWGRSVIIYAVDIQIANGMVIPLSLSQVSLSPQEQRATILSFTPPQGTPIGQQQMIVNVWILQTTLLFAGQEGLRVSISLEITVTP